MSLRECRRKDCENIMCSKYSTRYGYICDDCFEEMKGLHIPIAMFLSISKNDLPSYNYDEEYKDDTRDY